MPVPVSRRNIFFIAIAAALLLLYIVPLGSYPLMEPDEGRYAEIPREMIASGNYITPMLNYVKYFEKPALLYWMNAASFHIFGENEFAARVGVALCALLGAAATALLGAFMYGKIAGFIAGVVTATSLLYFAIGTINITDMPLSAFMTAAFASFYVAHVREEKKYYLLFYLFCALALLTKGLVGVVLPGAVIFFYILFTRQWKLFYKPLYLPGIALFFAVSLPWFYLVCRDNPDFFRFFFIQEHFLRYSTKMHGRYEPFWFFLPMIPAALIPWTAFLFSLFSKKSVVRSPGTPEEGRARCYLLIWFFVILIFFSFSSSKLIPYIVPCLPPLAILIGADIFRMAKSREWHGRPLLWLSLTSGLLGAALIIYPLFGEHATPAKAWPIALKAGFGLIGMPVTMWYYTSHGRKKHKEAIRALILCSALFISGLQDVYAIVAPQRTMKEVSEVIIREMRDGDTIVAYDEVLQGIPFYTKRRVMMAGSPGELEYGSMQPEGEGWFISKEEFLSRWRERKERFILVVKKNGRFEEIFPDGETGGAEKIERGKYVILFYREEAAK
ncbi:MAG: glycosyltransferase family 39 protein [Synergistaceae bacterium]|nr:glycosyltransferase family 39 protein [Synergistaceae bacterium]